MNETDFELLKLAASAAGQWPSPEPFEHVLDRWNPLDDDGDSSRLGVQLKICITHDFIEVAMDERQGYTAGQYEEAVIAWVIPTRGESAGKIIEISEICGNDPNAATRRAIVRVAAKLAKRDKF